MGFKTKKKRESYYMNSNSCLSNYFFMDQKIFDKLLIIREMDRKSILGNW